jgi:hypothetical protein
MDIAVAPGGITAAVSVGRRDRLGGLVHESYHATPVLAERAQASSAPNLGRLRRRDVLGGLIHEYEYAA